MKLSGHSRRPPHSEYCPSQEIRGYIGVQFVNYKEAQGAAQQNWRKCHFFGCLYPTCHMIDHRLFLHSFLYSNCLSSKTPNLQFHLHIYQTHALNLEKIEAKNTKVNEDLFFCLHPLFFQEVSFPKKMSALVGAISKDFTFNPVMEKEENKDGEPTRECDDSEKPDDEGREDDEDDEAEEDGKPKSEKELENKELELGPQVSLKEQLEKDKVYSLSVSMFILKCTPLDDFVFLLLSKDDESLRRWKEQLLGTVDFSAVGGTSFSLSFPRT